jgi:hypothetical protein
VGSKLTGGGLPGLAIHSPPAMAHLMVHLPDHDGLLGRLQEERRLRRIEQIDRHAGRPAARLARIHRLAARSTSAFDFCRPSLANCVRFGLLRSAIRKVVYMNVPHSENPKPSWYGESVGRYEGDTLVVDTIGQTTKTFLDNYRTPHGDKLHVVERYRLVDGGNALQADIAIDDPATFVQPLQVIHRWRRVQGPMLESSCAEGNFNYFNQDVEPLPTAERPDF